mgnify:CR=1 FL=1
MASQKFVDKNNKWHASLKSNKQADHVWMGIERVWSYLYIVILACQKFVSEKNMSRPHSLSDEHVKRLWVKVTMEISDSTVILQIPMTHPQPPHSPHTHVMEIWLYNYFINIPRHTLHYRETWLYKNLLISPSATHSYTKILLHGSFTNIPSYRHINRHTHCMYILLHGYFTNLQLYTKTHTLHGDVT